MSRANAGALAALSLVALIVALYLTYVHYRLHLEPGWHSACAISDTISCDAVLTSSYGSIAGTPLSALGACFYLLAALIGTVRLFGYSFPRSPALVLLIAGGFASALSIFLVVVSVTISAYCPLCGVLHVVNLAMLVLSWRALKSTGESFQESFSAERKHWKRHATPATLYPTAAIIMFLGVFWLFSQDPVTPSQFCRELARLMTAERGSAPVPVFVYLDFQCRHCRDLDQALRTVRRNPGIRIVPQRYPLERACNPNVRRQGHRGACLQARAAICAEGVGAYNEMSDQLFDTGTRDEAGLVTIANSIGLDPVVFRSCLSSTDTIRGLHDEIAGAKANGVSATPTVHFAGVKHVGSLTRGDRACLSKLGSSQGDDPSATAP